MSAMEERGRIGRAIRRARRDRGISLRELARLVGVSPGTISAIENGKTGITIARLSRIASALGVPPAALLEEPPPERA
ncbi:MAG: helix-turn-helix transcriptional regulator, partial [Thermobispora bispora]|nr:helix-turn-helix transcriptional regulator [Thermobispora bispora]